MKTNPKLSAFVAVLSLLLPSALLQPQSGVAQNIERVDQGINGAIANYQLAHHHPVQRTKNAELDELNKYLAKAIPSIKQISNELFKMHALVASDERFDLIQMLAVEMKATSDQMSAIAIAINSDDVAAAMPMIEKLNKLASKLNISQTEFDSLMSSVAKHPEKYPVLTPQVLQEMMAIADNLNKINRSLSNAGK